MMKRTVDEHARRFDQQAPSYDESERPVYAACKQLVIEAAAPGPEDVVLDIGTGTGAIAITLASEAAQVIGRDISAGMLAQARENIGNQTNVEFGEGSFRDPNYDGEVDIITTNYAMHHLDEVGKRAAIGVIAGYRPRRFVLGDVMFFGETTPEEPAYDPAVDEPATGGMLVTALTAVGFEVTAAETITDQVGVLVAEEPREGWPR